MIVGVPTEAIAGENRVAQTPETAKQLVDMGLTVHVHKERAKLPAIPIRTTKTLAPRLCRRLMSQKLTS